MIGRTLESRADEISNWLNMEPKPKPRIFTITATLDQVIERRFGDGVFTDEEQMRMQLLWEQSRRFRGPDRVPDPARRVT